MNVVVPFGQLVILPAVIVGLTPCVSVGGPGLCAAVADADATVGARTSASVTLSAPKLRTNLVRRMPKVMTSPHPRRFDCDAGPAPPDGCGLRHGPTC